MPNLLDEIEGLGRILAPSYNQPGQMIELDLDADRVRALAERRRITDIYEIFYNLYGVVPPVNNIGYHEANAFRIVNGHHVPFKDSWGGLRHAHAIFRGLERPRNELDGDKGVYIYVVNPRFRYKFIVDTVCLAKRVPVPSRRLFVVYVTFDNDVGKVVHLDWLESSPDNGLMPVDYNSRYEKMVWQNG